MYMHIGSCNIPLTNLQKQSNFFLYALECHSTLQQLLSAQNTLYILMIQPPSFVSVYRLPTTASYKNDLLRSMLRNMIILVSYTLINVLYYMYKLIR